MTGVLSTLLLLGVLGASGWSLRAAGQDLDRVVANQLNLPTPTPTTTTTVPVAAEPSVGTPAAAFIDTVLTDPTFTSTVPAAQRRSPSVLTTPACFTLPTGTTSTAVTTPSTGVSVQLFVTPAGAGTATAQSWAAAVRSCSGLTKAKTVTPNDAPAGTTVKLTIGGSGAQLAQAIWSRGDVVVAVTYAPPTPTTPKVNSAVLDTLRTVASAIDLAVVTHLAGVCNDLAPTVADATRNPTLPGYTPWAQTATIAVPTAGVDTPTAATTAPDLAVPDAQPVESLAPVAAFDEQDLDADATPAPLADADTLPAPVLRDPAAFATVTPVVDPGKAPVRPAAPSPVTYPVYAPDVTGPGCGWTFTGQIAPDNDPTSLAAATTQAREAALSTAAQAGAQHWVDQLAWAQTWAQWSAQNATYIPYKKYEQARQDAIEAWAAAVTTQQDAAATYTAALNTWLSNHDTTATPTPTPSAHPTTSATPTPTPTSTGSPS